jgi:hypothetical protein
MEGFDDIAGPRSGNNLARGCQTFAREKVQRKANSSFGRLSCGKNS